MCPIEDVIGLLVVLNDKVDDLLVTDLGDQIWRLMEVDHQIDVSLTRALENEACVFKVYGADFKKKTDCRHYILLSTKDKEIMDWDLLFN